MDYLRDHFAQYPQDFVNGGLEMLGAFFILHSVILLHKAKMVRGVSWMHTCFFMTWGWWNIYYYPSLDQWFSFIGGLMLVSVNTIWLCQILYYNHKERQRVQSA